MAVASPAKIGYQKQPNKRRGTIPPKAPGEKLMGSPVASSSSEMATEVRSHVELTRV
jgi:hypothetical protein